MRATVHPGGFEGGRTRVPGDKSIAHRWLILAATAEGTSELRGVPSALDVRATVRCLAEIVPQEARSALDGWALNAAPQAHGDRSTTNGSRPEGREIVLEGKGRVGLHAPEGPLDCENSGTTMRLLAGVLASEPFETVLVGDESLSRRPMERVAEPLRTMGADVRTTDGHAPVVVGGGPLRGVEHRTAVPSAQVKSAVILAGLAAEGETRVLEAATTRDHTERALRHLGAPVEIEPGGVSLTAFRHGGFSGEVPGDVSSAAYLVAAAALTGRHLVIEGVGLNPTRTAFLDVLERMGVRLETRIDRDELGEPVGTLEVGPGGELIGTTIEAHELPLLIDEVPMLAMLAAHARGETSFAGAGELRVKESDRLRALEAAIHALGGVAGIEGEDLVLGGGGLRGGDAPPTSDHRIAMAIAVSAFVAREPTTIDGIEAAEVSFPGFMSTLVSLGARIEG